MSQHPLQPLADALNELCAASIYIGPPPWAIPKPEPKLDYLTVKQVAEKLQISERSVARMIDKGLNTVKVGKSVRIKPSDLEQFLADQETVFD